ncbi:MAG: hypothetical protein DHS20C01_27010 [marine bacterium B5-7]|nr:MAG: hypothetical protein DHS20C01_27010 [marine bacterium B5-7]
MNRDKKFRRFKSAKSLDNENGFGLLETMITMLVLAFGLLALAYMETWGFRFGQDSEARTQASIIASDLMERMRVANVPPTSAQASNFAAAPSGTLTCTETDNTATNHRNCFFLELSERLPNSAASISIVSSTTPAIYEVTIAWTDRQSGKLSSSGTTPSTSDCTGKQRMASAGSNGLKWYPSSSKPSGNTCLNFIRWWMTP